MSWHKQAGRKQAAVILAFSDFPSSLALSGLGDIHLHMGGQLRCCLHPFEANLETPSLAHQK